MGLVISTSKGSGNVVPCTTTSSYLLATSTSSSYAQIPQVTLKSSTTMKTTTTSSAAASTPTYAKFYLKSSCDQSCVGHFAADDQLYSNLYSSTDASFDSFYLNGTQLYDASTSTFCVSSEAAGSETRFQCSNDLDYINGVAVNGVWGSAGGLLTYQNSPTWYGCGTVDLENNYEPNGLTYSTVDGDTSNCQACTFSLVTDITQCNAGGQIPATTISTTYLPPATFTSSASSSSTSTSCTKTTSSTAAATTPKSCGTGYCKVNWLAQADCYLQNCQRCPSGTSCQTYQTWPWALQACLPKKSSSWY